MNPNGTYESEVNRKIDRALATGQPTGDPIVDELAAAQPKANLAFQQRLEDTLIERLEARKKPMITPPTLIEREQPRKRFALPATLVAAMLAVLFGGMIFSTMNRAPDHSGAALISPERTAEQIGQVGTATPVPMGQIDELSLSATALIQGPTQTVIDLTLTAPPIEAMGEIDPFPLTATALVAEATQHTLNLTASATPIPAEGLFITFTPVPTTMPTINIVAAVQNISRGQTITTDMIDYRPWPEPYVPLSAIVDLEAVVGKVARTDIVREQPILTGLITEASGIGRYGELTALPPNTRLIDIPVTAVEGMDTEVQPGERVDILAVNPEHWDVVVWNALVITLQYGGGETILSVAVSPDDAVKLTNAVDNGQSLTIAPVEAQVEVVVARVDVAAGTQLTGAMLTIVYYPADAVPEAAFSSINDAAGFFVYTPISRGYPVTQWALQSITPTPTKTFTPSITPNSAATLPPTPPPSSTFDVVSTPVSVQVMTVTPPAVLCQLVVTNADGVFVRSHSGLETSRLATLPFGTPLNVINYSVLDDDTSTLWYFITASLDGQEITGWIRAENVEPLPGSVCPSVPSPQSPEAVVVTVTTPPLPSVTLTPEILCRVRVNNEEGLLVRSRPTIQSARVTTLPSGMSVEVTQQLLGVDDSALWYFIIASLDGQEIVGWIQAEDVASVRGWVCPSLPESPTPPAQ